MNKNYSFLMSVYFKEKPDFLKQSIESMISQTLFPSEILIVKDGPLTSELDNIINFYVNKYENLFNVITIEKNVGLGRALNIGMSACKNEFIARMDSDDICISTRCERQMEIFNSNPAVGIVGSFVNEFDTDVSNIVSKRTLPVEHEDILEFSRKRCPFNHPTVMYKKSLVTKAGGYKDFLFFEDYFLWVRMLRDGVISYNIPEFLVSMRAGAGMYKRRGGISYFKRVYKFRKYLLSNKYCSVKDFILSVSVQFVFCIIPNGVRHKFYKKFLRG